MTPQESELVDELFNRLVQLETAQRDPDAERLIADGLRRAPHAVYALVQTVLLQDEALKRANARIEELKVQTSATAEPEQRPASFLDRMREALGRAPHGLVPSVRTAGANQSQAVCDVCGNDYDKAFRITQAGKTLTFDSFECAIHAMAPRCAHCQCHVIGHGIEAGRCDLLLRPLRKAFRCEGRQRQSRITRAERRANPISLAET